MKYLRSPQDAMLGIVPTLKTSLYASCLMAMGLALLAHTAQAESTLPYQPTLGNYQRFEQSSPAVPAQPSPAHDHAAHEVKPAVIHDHQQHEMSAHDQHHEHSHAHEE